MKIKNIFFRKFKNVFVSPCTAIFVCIFFQAGWAGRGRLSVILSIEKSRRNVENPRKKSAKMRYKLRSSTKSDSNETQADRSSTREAKDSLCHSPVASTSKSDSSGGPPEKKARICCRRKVVHKASLQSIKSENPDGIKDIKVEHSTTILNLGVDIVLYLAKYLDASSLICLYRSCHYFYDMLRHR